jgi:hypothetical protein
VDTAAALERGYGIGQLIGLARALDPGLGSLAPAGPHQESVAPRTP